MPSKTRTSERPKRRKKAPRPKARAKAKPLRKNPFVALLREVRVDIDNRLGGFLDAKVEASRTYGDDVTQMISAIRDLSMRGGKRMRPAMLVAGYRSVSATSSLEPALDAGICLELLQSYFLTHDDWMDQDDFRRGGPSVHAQLSRKFRSRKKGEWSAILAGDYAVALAAESLSQVDVPAARMPAMLACFAQMQTDAVLGQQLDVMGRAPNPEVVYVLKTASYTVRGPLRLGAVLGGAPPRTLNALDRFALPVGVAFQLRDDTLSLFGDPEKTGKPFANDLREGKRTVLLTQALERARGRDRQKLAAAAGNSKATRKQLEAAIGIIETSGARAAVEKRISALVAEGLAALEGSRITKVGRELLEGAARALTERRS